MTSQSAGRGQLFSSLASLGIALCGTAISFFLWKTTQEQLNETKRTSQGQIILELNRDFTFNERMYSMRKAIELKQPILSARGGKFTEQDIDDYIGFFEMVSTLVERGILNCTLVADNFDVYIKIRARIKKFKNIFCGCRKTLEKICTGDLSGGGGRHLVITKSSCWSTMFPQWMVHWIKT